MNENPEKITYKQLWDRVFYDYEPKGNRLNRIFDPNSDYNKRLKKYSRLCEELKPDFDNELKKLGFNEKVKIIYPDYVTPDHEDFYYNEKRDVISVSQYGTMLVEFNDQEKSFGSDVIGENQRMALKWIKEIIEVVNERK